MTPKSPITNIAQHLHVSNASCLSLYISSTSRQTKDAHGLSALNFDFANTREERDCGVDDFNITSKRIILSYRYQQPRDGGTVILRAMTYLIYLPLKLRMHEKSRVHPPPIAELVSN